jgi:hypothetical protein
MIQRVVCIGLLGISVYPAAVDAQATADQARLIFTVSAGAVTGKHLWSVSPQAVQFTSPADTFALGRRINSTLAVGFGGAYFPGEALGLTVEGFLVGLGFEDSCRHIFNSGAGSVAEACESIQGASKAATAVVLSAGAMYRVNSRKPVSPYARFNAGLVFSNQSAVRTIGQYPSQAGPVDLIIYDDDHSSRVNPALALGAGFTAVVGSGYQLRWEIRDNIVGVQRVLGPIPFAGGIPAHEQTFKHLFSLTIGFDVVLERRRGRRY